jgi:hypothetical protein
MTLDVQPAIGPTVEDFIFRSHFPPLNGGGEFVE